jgi:hypothetical protein
MVYSQGSIGAAVKLNEIGFTGHGDASLVQVFRNQSMAVETQSQHESSITVPAHHMVEFKKASGHTSQQHGFQASTQKTKRMLAAELFKPLPLPPRRPEWMNVFHTVSFRAA